MRRRFVWIQGAAEDPIYWRFQFYGLGTKFVATVYPWGSIVMRSLVELRNFSFDINDATDTGLFIQGTPTVLQSTLTKTETTLIPVEEAPGQSARQSFTILESDLFKSGTTQTFQFYLENEVNFRPNNEDEGELGSYLRVHRMQGDTELSLQAFRIFRPSGGSPTFLTVLYNVTLTKP